MDAAWEDFCSMVMQEQELNKFLSGIGKSMGKGQSVAGIAAKQKSAQNKRAKDYAQAFKEGKLTMEPLGEDFVPLKKARHKPPQTFSSSNPTERNLAEVINQSQEEPNIIDLQRHNEGNNGMLQPNNQMEPQQNNQNPPHYIPPIVLGSEEENPPLLCFFPGAHKEMLWL